MTRFLARLTSTALVVASAAPAAAQTIHYALPEPGEYQCLVPSTMPGMKYNVLTQKAELSSNLSLLRASSARSCWSLAADTA